jgi:hypothetical protein
LTPPSWHPKLNLDFPEIAHFMSRVAPAARIGVTLASGSSRLKRIAEFWPHILLAISIVGLALKLYQGTL